jgi:hypothetical protein
LNYQKRGPKGRGNPGGLAASEGVLESCTAAWIATSRSPSNDSVGVVTTFRSSLLTEVILGLQFVDPL